jgi:hypothetical protein
MTKILEVCDPVVDGNLIACSTCCSAFLIFLDVVRRIRLSFRLRYALAAENLFLRKQLALYAERSQDSSSQDGCQVNARIAFQTLCVQALTIVKPDTFVR